MVGSLQAPRQGEDAESAHLREEVVRVSGRPPTVYDQRHSSLRKGAPMGRYGSISEGGLGSVAATERVSGFLRGVYGWMCAGLAMTALVAFYVAGTNWATTLAQTAGSCSPSSSPSSAS